MRFCLHQRPLTILVFLQILSETLDERSKEFASEKELGPIGAIQMGFMGVKCT